MVVVTCSAPNCGWTSEDREVALAVLLAAELSNHTATNHSLQNATNLQPPTKIKHKVNPPSIKLGTTMEQFRFFKKRWRTFKTSTGIVGDELIGLLMDTTSEDLRFAMFTDNPDIENQSEADIMASIQKLAVKVKKERVRGSIEEVIVKEEGDIKEEMDVKVEVILEEEGDDIKEEVGVKEEVDVKKEMRVEITPVVEENIEVIETRTKRKGRQITGGGKREKSELYCFLCQVYGHDIENACVVNPRCFNCGTLGHVRKDCTSSVDVNALHHQHNGESSKDMNHLNLQHNGESSMDMNGINTFPLPKNVHENVDEGTSLLQQDNVKFQFFFIEIETIKASNSSQKHLTQIGCHYSRTATNRLPLFSVIKPEALDHYLDDFKKNCDLLQLLNMQKNDADDYELRKMIEVSELEPIQCIGEYEALIRLREFLGEKCVLFSQLESNIEVILGRMIHYGINTDFIKGFCTWKHFLRKTGEKQELDFDDWYKENSNKVVPEYLDAGMVAEMVWESVHRKIISDSIAEGTPDFLNVLLNSSLAIDSLMSNTETNEGLEESDKPIECLEYRSSFRPAMPIVITMKGLKILTLHLSDDEDGDVKIGEEITIDDEEEDSGQNLEITILNEETIKHSKKIPQQHVCGTCGKKFAYLRSLNTHLKSHEGEPKYQCKICSKGVATSKALRDHVRRSHGGPILMCDLCPDTGKGFKSSEAYENHQNIHHSPRKCNFCNAICKSKLEYNEHYRKNHNIRPHKKLSCQYCSSTLSGTASLKRHMLAHHPENSLQEIDPIWIKGEDQIKSENQI